MIESQKANYDRRASETNRLAGLLCALIGLALGACSNAPTCEEPEEYESAELGKRIVPPDDLDELPAYKEMVIPESSPRPPRSADAGCLDRPPVLRVDGEDSLITE